MPRLPRAVTLTLLAIISVVLAVVIAFVVDRAANSGEVLGSVEVGGIDLGGLSERDAVAAVRALETELVTTPVNVAIGGHTFSLDPVQVGFDIDEEAIVGEAMTNGRTGNVVGQFFWWTGHFTSDPVNLAIDHRYDETAIEGAIENWEVEGIDQPARPGNVWMNDGAIHFEYPRAGTGIDRSSAFAAITASLTHTDRPTIPLSTRFIQPALDEFDIDRVVEEAHRIIGEGVTLVAPAHGTDIVIPQGVIARSLLITRDDTRSAPEFKYTILGKPSIDYIAAYGPFLETAPVDAEINIDVTTDIVTIDKSRPVIEPDPTAIPAAVRSAIYSEARAATLPYRSGREADFSTEDAEALGIRELIGEFTTFHACCQARVTNIQLIADSVDDVMIMPGEIFNLNDLAGRRTTAKGYVCAGAILGGELVEEGEICIGGGTSQFTTTMYNAAFFAGLEDIAHTPHSIWFSRYPEGREATLGWREPELIFRNNTPNAIVIRTTHTDTSITAKIYGDNGGLIVEAGLSDRYNFSGPITTTRRARPDEDIGAPHCTPGTALQIQNGTGGWTVDIYRYLNYPDGTQVTETQTWHYTGYHRVKVYNPNDPVCNEDEPEEEA